MRIAVFVLGKEGYSLACKINGGYEKTEIYAPLKIAKTINEKNIIFFDEPLSKKVSKIFNDYEILIFVMALGIVVRVIAPLINNKESDPAILTLDEGGRFCISTLGGHEAGANKLAKEISALTDTEPVVTTASETSDIVLGIGLRKNKTKQEIREAIESALQKKNLPLSNVKQILSIDIKKSDKSLAEACKELSLPLCFVSKHQIEELDFDFNGSDFVDNSIGVKAVCEPAALIGSNNKQLIMNKTAYGGITIAIAR